MRGLAGPAVPQKASGSDDPLPDEDEGGLPPPDDGDSVPPPPEPLPDEISSDPWEHNHIEMGILQGKIWIAI